MRPALNAAPAIGTDGTIYTVTRTHLLDAINRYGGIAAINPDLTPKWWTSFRNRLNDGCNNDAGTFPGALLPANGTPGGCRLGATPGVDPAQNTQPAGRVLDDSSSSITVAPDGSILYGSYARYDFARGHLMKFRLGGTIQGRVQLRLGLNASHLSTRWNLLDRDQGQRIRWRATVRLVLQCGRPLSSAQQWTILHHAARSKPER